MADNTSIISKMPPLSSKWMSYHTHAIDNPPKPTHFCDGTERPATTKHKQALVDKWTLT